MYENMKMKTLILSILLSVAIFMNYVIPPPLAQISQSIIGQLMMLTILLLLFLKKQFILGILLFIFIIKLHMETSIQSYIPSELKKMTIMKSLNNSFDSVSLEEEIIHNRIMI
jgi:hypothetical protein